MRFKEISEGVGLVVPGVNTTPDVGPNEIKKQAAKLGLKVDKNGVPVYTMHKKAHKNSDPNKLFNLGMAESKTDEWKIMPQTIKPMGLIHKPGKGPNNRFDFKNKGNNKANEVTAKELSSASEIYVDMDGVLVDFFGPWTKLLGVSNWREIKDINAALQKIRDTEDFWIKLPKAPNADKLLGIIKDIKGDYTILSAPLADDPRVEPSKREWAEKNLTTFPPKEIIINTNKAKYATQPDGTPNILIDDFGTNIAKWEAAGGVGFKHKDHKFERTAMNLKKYFEKPANERELSKGEEKEKERIVKGMKKATKDFKKRYGDDYKAVMYATATKLAKEGYDLTADGYEHLNHHPLTQGKAPPQVKENDLNEFVEKEGLIDIGILRPVQRHRSWDKLAKQIERVTEGDYAPLTIDKLGYIVNGHHRYDVLKMMGETQVKVRLMKGTLKEILKLMQDK